MEQKEKNRNFTQVQNSAFIVRHPTIASFKEDRRLYAIETNSTFWSMGKLFKYIEMDLKGRASSNDAKAIIDFIGGLTLDELQHYPMIRITTKRLSLLYTNDVLSADVKDDDCFLDIQVLDENMRWAYCQNSFTKLEIVFVIFFVCFCLFSFFS